MQATDVPVVAACVCDACRGGREACPSPELCQRDERLLRRIQAGVVVLVSVVIALALVPALVTWRFG